MKRHLVISFLIGLFFSLSDMLPAQGYMPLDLSEGATWAQNECGSKPDWGAVYKLKIYGDTVVQDHIYQKLYYQYKRSDGVCSDCNFSFNRDSATLFALIRQDSDKRRVYFIYPPVSDKEWLGYDFDISSVGQNVTGFSLIISNEPEATMAALYVYQMEVDGIDSVCVNGEYVRRYYFGPGSGGNPYHYPEHWVEGIGSTHGLLVQGFGGPDWLHKLYCFNNKEEGVYYDSTAIMSCIAPNTLSCSEGMDCTPPTAIDLTRHKDKIAVYPNPIRNNLIVECHQVTGNVEIIFMDMMGITVWQKILVQPGELSTVPVHDLPSGFYFMTIRAGDFFSGQKMFRE